MRITADDTPIELSMNSSHMIRVEIVRLTDDSFPGWAECVLRDASGHEWLLADKLPTFTEAPLDATSKYPQPGMVACEIVREWTDEHGRKRCIVSSERPWGVAAKS